MFLRTYYSTKTEWLRVVTLDYGTSCIEIFHCYCLPEAALLFGHLLSWPHTTLAFCGYIRDCLRSNINSHFVWNSWEYNECYGKGPLRLHLQPPCWQMCGLNLNTDMVCAWLLTVSLLDIYNLLSVDHRSEALRYKAESRGSDSQWCYWNNPSGRTVALGSNQSLTEMITRNFSRRVKAASA